MAKIEHPRVPVDAIVNLVNHQKQCDQDGVMVQVSRQALAEVLIYVKEVRPDNKWADTGDVAKKPNNDGLPEMLEAARTELRKAVAKVASLEAEKSDLVDIIWRQMQQAEAHTFAPAQPTPDSAIDVLREIVEYETKSAIELEALTGDEMPELPWMAKAEAVLAAQPPAAPVERLLCRCHLMDNSCEIHGAGKAPRQSSAATDGAPPWWKMLADNWRGRNGNTVTGDSVRNSCADELEKVAARHHTVEPQPTREPGDEHPILKHCDELHELGFNDGWNGAVDECASMLAREYPDNANTNAFCAAIRSLAVSRPHSRTGESNEA